MQPRTLVILLVILPTFAANGSYLLSAYEELIPWCMPYIDGCTTISRAARSGNSIYIFRATTFTYSVLLILFWIYSRHWLNLLHGRSSNIANAILWLGFAGAISLLVYIDYLGTPGEVNRVMRRYGVMLYFTLTPLSQLLMLDQHYKLLRNKPGASFSPKVLGYQLVILIVMLIIAVIHILLDVTGSKTDVTDNIVEWNFSFLLTMYFVGMFFIWENYRITFSNSISKS